MIRFRYLLRVLLVLAMAFSLSQAKRAPAKRSGEQPRGDCKTMADSLVHLYEAGDPAYLTWDFSSAKCDSSRLYTAYYYQGIGFLFISAWKEAVYFLSAARDIGGPMDEEILYHLWTVYQKLDRYQEMERLTLELHQRYPSSLFLLEILDQWKSVKSTTRVWSWGYSSKAAWAGTRTPYLDKVLTNRLSGETGQKWGVHQLRETGSMSLKSKWDERPLQGFQANLGAEYEHGGFSAEANWGIGYESRKDSASVFISNGTQSLLVDSNWNFQQGRVAAGYSFTTHSGWNLGWNASLFQLSPDWRAGGISHSQSLLFSDFILIGYVDLQKHWIREARDPTGYPFGYGDLDGMMIFSFSLTPYFSSGKHSLGIGPTYYAARLHYGGSDSLYSIDDSNWQHSLTGTASYGYDLRPWCRLDLSASFGYDFDNSVQTTAYTRKVIYRLDTGFSLSY
ncbi:MAG TPA: hypothetical protein VJ385_11060 [Fibrobacteria bacterium]|nr:hypothetical protein [Fibrobacteria bacterium]